MKGNSKVKKSEFQQILDAVRQGCSLFEACRKVGVSTKEFYQSLNTNESLKIDYHLAGADFADQCTDEIKQILSALKAGEIDNSTAKLLIETNKWLQQKFCPESFLEKNSMEKDDNSDEREILVKFI